MWIDPADRVPDHDRQVKVLVRLSTGGTMQDAARYDPERRIFVDHSGRAYHVLGQRNPVIVGWKPITAWGWARSSNG